MSNTITAKLTRLHIARASGGVGKLGNTFMFSFVSQNLCVPLCLRASVVPHFVPQGLKLSKLKGHVGAPVVKITVCYAVKIGSLNEAVTSSNSKSEKPGNVNLQLHTGL